MTKTQMKNAALELMEAHGANKKLSAALTALFDEYAKTSKKETVKRETEITVDGNEYRWCNRHEVYEPITNFSGKKPDCKLATLVWSEHGKKVKQLNDKLMDMAMNGEDVQEIAAELKAAKEIRSGRYNFEDDAAQYPEIEDFIYSKNIAE